MTCPHISGHALKRAAERWQQGPEEDYNRLILRVVRWGWPREAFSGALKYHLEITPGQFWIATVINDCVVTVGVRPEEGEDGSN